MSEMGSIPMQLCDVAVPHLSFKQTIMISRPSISELSFPTCFQCFVSAADWLIISVPCQNEQCTMAGGLQAAMCARLQWSTMTEYRHGVRSAAQVGEPAPAEHRQPTADTAPTQRHRSGVMNFRVAAVLICCLLYLTVVSGRGTYMYIYLVFRL